MAQALTHVAFPAPVALKPEGPSDSIRGVAMTGWLVIVLFFGVLGTWAVTAPLNGAVVATGVVKVDGNRKSVQHLDGGIVKELRVREGDKVKAGDVVVVLDEGQARAEFEVLAQQAVVLRATEERLRAELTRATALMMPEDLRARGGRCLRQRYLEGTDPSVREPSGRDRGPAQRHQGEDRAARAPDHRRRCTGQGLPVSTGINPERDRKHSAAGRSGPDSPPPFPAA